MSHYHRHFSPADQKMNEDFEISFLLTRGKADDKSLLRVVGVSDKDRRTVVPCIARDRSCGRVTGRGGGEGKRCEFGGEDESLGEDRRESNLWPVTARHAVVTAVFSREILCMTSIFFS